MLGEGGGLASAATTLVAYDDPTGHNIPRVFRAFMAHQPTESLFTFGHPIVIQSGCGPRAADPDRYTRERHGMAGRDG